MKAQTVPYCVCREMRILPVLIYASAGIRETRMLRGKKDFSQSEVLAIIALSQVSNLFGSCTKAVYLKSSRMLNGQSSLEEHNLGHMKDLKH